MNTFTSPESWTGGHYEVAIELAEGSQDSSIARSLARLWSYPGLNGPYGRKDVEISIQSRLDPMQASQEHMFGIAWLPGRGEVPCGSIVTRFDGGSSWVLFYFPFSPLEDFYKTGGYPFCGEDSVLPWRNELDSWLAGIASYLFEDYPFMMALIGFEVEFGKINASSLRKKGIPSERRDTILWPGDAKLTSYSPTRSE